MGRLLAVVALIGVFGSLPSPASAGRMGWGLRTGWTGARLVGPGALGGDLAPDLRHTFTVGGFARIDLLPGLGFQPELAWVSKGGQGDFRLVFSGGGQTDVVDAEYEYRVNWIEVPLLVRWDLPVHALGSYLILGPAPAWRVGDGRSHLESFSMTSTGGPSPTRATAEIFEDVGTFDDLKFPAKSVDLGLAGGLGVRMGHGPLRFALEARYTRGLIDVHPGELEIKNEVFAVTTAIELR